MDQFLTDAQIAELHDLFDTGMRTVQAFNREPVVLTFERMNETSGEMVVVDTVEAISITFGLREGRSVNPFGGLTQDYADGDALFWADGFVPSVGDIADWQGFRIRVTKVFPPELGVVTVELDLQQVAP